jgi:hypothetical protein
LFSVRVSSNDDGNSIKILTRKSGFFYYTHNEKSFKTATTPSPGRQNRAALVRIPNEN